MQSNFLKVLVIILSIGFNCTLKTMDKDLKKGLSIQNLLDEKSISVTEDGKLDLNNMQLVEIKGLENVKNTKNIAQLLLSTNNFQLIKISKSLMIIFENLITLDLCYNKLKKLPLKICMLPQLQTLCLKANKLEELPSTIDNLISLTTLRLGQNQLTKLPETIKNLTKLEELSLHYNLLGSFSVKKDGLPYLKKFTLENNCLTIKALFDLRFLFQNIIDNSSGKEFVLEYLPQANLSCNAAIKFIEFIKKHITNLKKIKEKLQNISGECFDFLFFLDPKLIASVMTEDVMNDLSIMSHWNKNYSIEKREKLIKFNDIKNSETNTIVDQYFDEGEYYQSNNDHDKAIRWYKKVIEYCNEDNAIKEKFKNLYLFTMNYLGVFCWKKWKQNRKLKDFEKSIEWREKVIKYCNEDNATKVEFKKQYILAMKGLGLIYLEKWEQNRKLEYSEKVIEWLKKAAEEGSLIAMTHLESFCLDLIFFRKINTSKELFLTDIFFNVD